ncbi:MAG: MFS transporter [Betaproteobacteria bacterium]|nr:MFS transporter [Betaproteobacteria bacterium]MDH5219633.1 MFS transporter [Betaproteobacteria bacterium]MDH5350021.1 MFS transporter [Betaproteobacteria bacterium]
MLVARRSFSLVVIALTLSLAYGIWYSYSVILVALLQEFGWSRSVLAGAFSAFTLVHGAANPLVGALCDRVRPLQLMAAGGALLGLALWADSYIATPWQLYLGFGLFTAVSVASAGWIPALVQVQRDFQDRLGLALGIVSSGVGVGMLLVVPLTQLLIDAYGWRAAFRVLAVICVLWIVPSSLLLLRLAPRRAPVARSAAASGAARDVTLGQAMRGAPFWLMLSAFFFGNVCSQTLHVHQVAYLVDRGVAAIVAASVVGVVGLASIVGKTGGGWLSDRVERERVYVAGIAVMLAAVAVLASLGQTPALGAIYLYGALLGLGYSVTASLIPAMVSDRFSGPHFGAIVGMGLLGSAIGSAVGPWMAGYLFDRTGSYAIAFALAAACGFAAGVAGWRARTLRVHARPRP